MERVQNIPRELISKTVNVDCKRPLSEAGRLLGKYPAVVVTKDSDYLGIVDSRTIYRLQQRMKLPGTEKIEKFSVKAPRITSSTSIYDLINYFYKSSAKALPYSMGNRIIGVLERKTLLKVLLSLDFLHDMKVNEAMTTPVLAIDSDASLAQAKSTMREMKVNRLVVLKESRFIGLLTNYDIVRKLTTGYERLPEMRDNKTYKPSNVPIGSVMEPNVMSIEFNRPLSEAVRDMVENRVSSLVVLRNSRPIGMLTVTDVFESILARQKVMPSKIFMSGFDANTYQYEDEAREELTSLVGHVEKLSGIDVDYLTFKVKRTHSKLYEMQARLSLGRHGIITVHTNKYLFEDALAEVTRNLKHKVIKEKESILTHKKANTLREREE